MGMADRLGKECRAARQAADLSLLDIAQAAGVSEAAVSRFERGEAWPRRVDALIAAYERECGLPADELWRRAIRRPED